MAEPIGHALYRSIAQRSPDRADEYSPSWLTAIREATGGISQMARMLGVSRTTVQGWFGARGGQRVSQPSDRAKALMGLAMRRIRLPAIREARLQAARKLRIEGRDRYDDRPRIITLDRTHLRPGWQDSIINGYLTGGAVGATGGLVAAIKDKWYRGYFASVAPDHGMDVDRVRWVK